MEKNTTEKKDEQTLIYCYLEFKSGTILVNLKIYFLKNRVTAIAVIIYIHNTIIQCQECKKSTLLN